MESRGQTIPFVALTATPSAASSHTTESSVQPQRTPQHAEGEGRVGAGNEQVDGAVVDDLEHALGAALGDRMVQRGGEVQQDDGDREDARREDEHGITATQHGPDEERRGGQARRQSDAVADAVGDLLAQGLGTRGSSWAA